jgi:hypothetical protein
LGEVARAGSAETLIVRLVGNLLAARCQCLTASKGEAARQRAGAGNLKCGDLQRTFLVVFSVDFAVGYGVREQKTCARRRRYNRDLSGR